MKASAVVLAGRDNTGRLRECSGEAYEALIEIAGLPMAQYVVNALRACQYIGRVVVVGPRAALEERLQGEGLEFVDRGESLLDNVMLGASHLAGEEGKVLVATSDIPLLTPMVVEDFLLRCASREANLHYPIVSRRDTEARFPRARRTYVRLREGAYTGGNMMLLDPWVIDACARVASRFIAARKQPLKLATLLGFSFIVRFLLGRLALAQAEERVSRILGIRGAAVISPWPEVGMDVDKPEDLELAKVILEGGGAA